MRFKLSLFLIIPRGIYRNKFRFIRNILKYAADDDTLIQCTEWAGPGPGPPVLAFPSRSKSPSHVPSHCYGPLAPLQVSKQQSLPLKFNVLLTNISEEMTTSLRQGLVFDMSYRRSQNQQFLFYNIVFSILIKNKSENCEILCLGSECQE